MTADYETQFHNLIQDISSDEKTIQMKNYIQHGNITTYDHCMRVAHLAFTLRTNLKIDCSDEELIRGAFLHDYFLYDWHGFEQEADPDWILPARHLYHFFHMHGFTHPATALSNADRDFTLTEKECQIIRTHMWPLTLFHPPTSKEGFLVCTADKLVSLHETVMLR